MSRDGELIDPTLVIEPPHPEISQGANEVSTLKSNVTVFKIFAIISFRFVLKLLLKSSIMEQCSVIFPPVICLARSHFAAL